jgi:hypothetical protein
MNYESKSQILIIKDNWKYGKQGNNNYNKKKSVNIIYKGIRMSITE